MLRVHLVVAALAVATLASCTQMQERKFKAVAHDSFEDVLHDAASARFRNERVVWARGSNTDLALCGEVNAKNLMGAYVGWRKFVVVGFVSGSSKPFTMGPLIDQMSYLQDSYVEKRTAFCGT